MATGSIITFENVFERLKVGTVGGNMFVTVTNTDKTYCLKGRRFFPDLLIKEMKLDDPFVDIFDKMGVAVNPRGKLNGVQPVIGRERLIE